MDRNQRNSERIVRLEALRESVEDFFRYMDRKIDWSVKKSRPQRNRKAKRGPYSKLRDSFLRVEETERN